MDTIPAGQPAGDLRVSDADRDRAVSELGEHFQAGRLTAAELDERVGLALRARTGKDLAGLMADLPAAGVTAAAYAASGRTAHRLPLFWVTSGAGIVAVVVLAGLGHLHVVLVIPFVLLLLRCRARTNRSRPRSRDE
jgi:Flp pilus assembly protein TadB